jgi:ribosomal protein L32E
LEEARVVMLVKRFYTFQAGETPFAVTILVEKNKLVKKSLKKFEHMQSDRDICVKENWRRPKGLIPGFDHKI